MARVARAHEVNANLVFNWRRLYREGRFEGENPTTALLPVQITKTEQKPQQLKSARRVVEGTIDEPGKAIKEDVSNTKIHVRDFQSIHSVAAHSRRVLSRSFIDFFDQRRVSRVVATSSAIRSPVLRYASILALGRVSWSVELRLGGRSIRFPKRFTTSLGDVLCGHICSIDLTGVASQIFSHCSLLKLSSCLLARSLRGRTVLGHYGHGMLWVYSA